MTEVEREKALTVRKLRGHPWHRPPHFDVDGSHTYLITGSCKGHEPIIGMSPERMNDFESEIIENLAPIAWCVLPNHYHLVMRTSELSHTIGIIGKFHGRISYEWNGIDRTRGRRVWYRSTDRRVRNESHLWATVNYVHHNPVRHGYCKRWQDWPYSSASSFLASVGRKRALEVWQRHPLEEYGAKWDPQEL